MVRYTALGFIALIASAASAPAPQVCCVIPAPPPCPPPPPPCPCSPPPCPGQPADLDTPQPTLNGDGPIRVLVHKSSTRDQLRAANFQVYPVPGGLLYLHQNPDVIIQPPPILIKPPLLKPIQPAAINVQPQQLPPITPPPICVRPGPLPPITPAPICVRPKPLCPITPPAIIVKPPTPPLIQPSPISIRQPQLPPITPPPIVVRPQPLPNIQPPTIYLRTSVFDKNGNSDGQVNSGGASLSGLPISVYPISSPCTPCCI